MKPKLGNASIEYDYLDVISKGSSNKKFLNKIKNDEVLLYERKR